MSEHRVAPTMDRLLILYTDWLLWYYINGCSYREAAWVVFSFPRWVYPLICKFSYKRSDSFTSYILFIEGGYHCLKLTIMVFFFHFLSRKFLTFLNFFFVFRMRDSKRKGHLTVCMVELDFRLIPIRLTVASNQCHCTARLCWMSPVNISLPWPLD